MGDAIYSDGASAWLVRDLWAAAEHLPAESVPVASLAHHLDEWPWEPGEITPKIVAAHALRMVTAEQYPIILTPDGWVADGMHRLAWAWANGAAAVVVRRLVTMPPPLPATDPPDPFPVAAGVSCPPRRYSMDETKINTLHPVARGVRSKVPALDGHDIVVSDAIPDGMRVPLDRRTTAVSRAEWERIKAELKL